MTNTNNVLVRDDSELQWTCNICCTVLDPENEKDGIILSHEEMRNAEKREQDWYQYEKEQMLSEDIFHRVKWSRVFEIDETPVGKWLPYCSVCSEGVSDAYYIEIGRIRTLSQLIEWTVHLQGKRWVEQTNWREWMRTIAGESS